MLNMVDDIFKRMLIGIAATGIILTFLAGFIGYCIGSYTINKQEEAMSKQGEATVQEILNKAF